MPAETLGRIVIPDTYNEVAPGPSPTIGPALGHNAGGEVADSFVSSDCSSSTGSIALPSSDTDSDHSSTFVLNDREELHPGSAGLSIIMNQLHADLAASGEDGE